MKDQLGEAKAATANAASEYQSLAEIATLKQTIHDEAYKEAAKSFPYTTVTQHPDWDLDYLGEHLAAQIAECHAKLQANQPPTEERPARPPSLAAEPQAVPPPPPEALPEQVIERDQELVVRAAESDGRIEQIDHSDSVLDCQE